MNYMKILLVVFACICAYVLTTGAYNTESAAIAQPASISDNDIELITVSINGLDLLAMVHKSKQTICLYGYDPTKPEYQRFKLMATRYYGYDMMLKDFNTGKPTPDDILMILEKQLEAELNQEAADDNKTKQ